MINLARLAGLWLAVGVIGTRPAWPQPSPPAATSPAPSAPASLLFSKVGKGLGIDFVHSFGDEELTSVVQDTTGGVCWIDYDRDGYPDLVFVGGAYLKGLSKTKHPERMPSDGTCRLFHNDRGQHFTDVTRQAGIVGPPFGMCACAGYHDGDGWPDLYVTGYHGNRLYRNRRDGTFEDATSRAGVELVDRLSTGATFLDYDNDGRLDLFVGNYLDYDPAYTYHYPADRYRSRPTARSIDSSRKRLSCSQGLAEGCLTTCPWRAVRTSRPSFRPGGRRLPTSTGTATSTWRS